MAWHIYIDRPCSFLMGSLASYAAASFPAAAGLICSAEPPWVFRGALRALASAVEPVVRRFDLPPARDWGRLAIDWRNA